MNKGNKNKKIKNDELKAQELRREKEKGLAEAIEALLVAEGFALQPFMSYSEFGIAPRVRLVEVNKPTTNGQDTSEVEVEGAGDADGASEPSES